MTSGHSPAVAWRRNLTVVWTACLVASLGMSLTNPFIPLFLLRELDVTDPSTLAFWSGLAVAANGVTIIFVSPFWGGVADRYGRKPMLIRALGGSAFFVAVLATAQSSWHVIAARLGLGLVTGFVPASSAIIAEQVPRPAVGSALGLIAAAAAIGAALGPIAGAALIPFVGLRGAFLCAGASIGAGAGLVWLRLRSAPAPGLTERTEVLRELREVEPRTRRAIVVLLTAQCFLWMYVQSMQPMLALKVIELEGQRAALITGAVFGVIGLTSAAASLMQARVARAVGYRPVAFAGVAVSATATLIAATARESGPLIISVALVGLASGGLLPALASILGLRTPTRVVSTVFGLSNSAMAVGFTIGPFVTGIVAASGGASLALALTTAPLLAMIAVLTLLEEPATGAEVSR